MLFRHNGRACPAQTAAATAAQCQLQTEDGHAFRVTAAPGPDEVGLLPCPYTFSHKTAALSL